MNEKIFRENNNNWLRNMIDKFNVGTYIACGKVFAFFLPISKETHDWRVLDSNKITVKQSEAEQYGGFEVLRKKASQPGLPDFSWYNIPKCAKYTKMTKKYITWP
jgi:hypothetical protein